MAAGTGTQKELRVQIMDLQPGDLPAVRALELECFSDAWSEKLLQDLLTSSWDKTWVLKRMKPSVATAISASLPGKAS